MAGVTFKKLAAVHQGAEVDAGSDIIAAVTVKRTGLLLVTVSVDTSTVVQIGIDDLTSDDESTREVLDLNGGAALTAGRDYVFTHTALSGYAYSLVNKSGAAASTIPHASFVIEEAVG